MKFLIQHNLMNPQQLEEIRKAVLQYPTVYVGLIPFSREFTANEDISGKEFIPYGSTLMTTLGQKYEWEGLHFDPITFNYQAALDNRDDMLNSNVIRLDEAIRVLDIACRQDPHWLYFTRPSEDLKQFSGQVIEALECRDWFKSMLECDTSGSYKLDAETMVVLCQPQTILAEFRWFVVGGKVISGSMYRCHGQMRQEQCTDQALIDEAQTFADKWLPDSCCVMDLALTEDGVKVIEFNTINSSGFYKNDIQAVFDALWEFHQK